MKIEIGHRIFTFLRYCKFNFFSTLHEILYKSDIIRCILLKLSEKYILQCCLLIFNILLNLKFQSFNFEQTILESFLSTLVFSVRMEIPCTPQSMHAHTRMYLTHTYKNAHKQTLHNSTNQYKHAQFRTHLYTHSYTCMHSHSNTLSCTHFLTQSHLQAFTHPHAHVEYLQYNMQYACETFRE